MTGATRTIPFFSPRPRFRARPAHFLWLEGSPNGQTLNCNPLIKPKSKVKTTFKSGGCLGGFENLGGKGGSATPQIRPTSPADQSGRAQGLAKGGEGSEHHENAQGRAGGGCPKPETLVPKFQGGIHMKISEWLNSRGLEGFFGCWTEDATSCHKLWCSTGQSHPSPVLRGPHIP